MAIHPQTRRAEAEAARVRRCVMAARVRRGGTVGCAGAARWDGRLRGALLRLRTRQSDVAVW